MRIRTAGLIALAATLGVGACDLLTDPPERLVAILRATVDGAELPTVASMADCTCEGCLQWNDLCLLDLSDHILHDAPDTVTAGVPFEVRFQVHMPSAPQCRRADGAGIAASQGLVEVVSYDIVVGRGCPDGPGSPYRAVTLVIPEPGQTLVRIMGNVALYGPDLPDDSTWVELWGRIGARIDHPVVVRP